MSVYNFSVKTHSGDDVSLKTYEGQVLLVVNTAPKCGLVGQYEGIESLHKTYQDKGFEVLDFPCNQFMNQAPQSDEEIQTFCELNYQTTFKTFAKIKVNGHDADPLYKYLKKKQPKDLNQEGKHKGGLRALFGSSIKWNFTKFLVNKKGEVIYRFSPTVKSEVLKPYIEALLKEN